MWFIFIYVSTNRVEREVQWDYLRNVCWRWGKVWCMEGDFNDVCCHEEKKGGNKRSDSSFIKFNMFINDLGMHEIKMDGQEFTWANNRYGEGFVEEKLDRFLGSFEWQALFPNAIVKSEFKSSSHHFLLVLNSKPNLHCFKKRFSFDKRWLKKVDIQDVVGKAWQIPQWGSSMFQLQAKIKVCRVNLLKWSRNFKSESTAKMDSLKNKMEYLRAKGGNRNWNEWNFLKRELQVEYNNEESYWKQKSRVQWLQEGDKNSKFFYAFTMQKRKRNCIRRLIDDNNCVREKEEEIEATITDFYKTLFQSEGSVGDMNLLDGIPHSITTEMNKDLVAPVEEAEIKQALFDMHPHKAPGPDGKEILIRSVLDALLVYVMACFKLPVCICKMICTLSANFWWGFKNSSNQKIHWKAWDKIIVPKEAGGLGFHDILLFNEALMAKQLWRIITNPNHLVSKVLKAKYFPSGNLLNVEPGYNASWLWRCWLGARNTLKKGLRFEVGDGQSINTWNDPWIPEAGLFKPSRGTSDISAQGRVCDFLNQEGDGWNRELVEEVFSSDDCSKILNINSMQRGKKYKFVWHMEKKGNFSVKSTYSHLVWEKVGKMDLAEHSGNLSIQQLIRNKSWRLKIKGKIKHFIWKCFSGILPTKCCVRNRGMDIDVVCKSCGESEETLEHIFFNCPRAQIIWKLSHVQWEGLATETDSFHFWWGKFCGLDKEPAGVHRIQLTTYVLWWLWKTRNLWLFENSWKSERDTIINTAVGEWLEFERICKS